MNDFDSDTYIDVGPDFRSINQAKGLFTWREEDPRRRIVLAPYVFCVLLTSKKLYMF